MKGSKNKKLIVISLLILILVFENLILHINNYTVSAAAPQLLYGDVDVSGEVNSLDYALIKSYLLGNITDFPDVNGKKAADVNGDGSIDSLDISLIKSFILGIIERFPIETPANTFAKGADISWLPQMEASGYKFYNNKGLQQDCLQILKDYGVNSVRIRTWVNPSTDKWNGHCSTNETIALAKRAKNLGFRIMIDFHYSDSWADPGKQTKPAAWLNLDFNGLMKMTYDYTYDVMTKLRNNGILPEWVQVGNETNNGMLWEDGKASNNMKNFAWLVNCGYDAVKAVNPKTKVIVHISNGFNNTLFRWMFDGLNSNGAKYDVIGMSLYPDKDNYPALLNQCLNNMNDMVSRYNKEIMICEIGMQYNYASESKAFIIDMVNKTKSLPNNKGLGVFYWEPESYPGMNGYNKGCWNSDGKPTIALDGFLN
ncbi:glycosyl hydrolase 53 family protein [Ruminiclostridium cellulolyticum]|uniref:Arabinogalactan endo-beta-1,4-galactanase n=1 Tax=Ruminiclostridium cellulolyticum (strain ATCC 35319 / DSM 5812 / JCM 6584 / H10) TaxID=394503 RepID=B8I434_RUMCH|nr:glycosyl hydrolase 53 family protein [Ruminiclostridium cellulolyticum]ACL76467.1 glycosyl hydrolase 53 domain protein [Ruminiclostridium cellulolyticum H10]